MGTTKDVTPLEQAEAAKNAEVTPWSASTPRSRWPKPRDICISLPGTILMNRIYQRKMKKGFMCQGRTLK